MYRPTPVVNLGRAHVAAHQVPMRTLRGGEMRGPFLGGRPSGAPRATRYLRNYSPWITRSGTMAGYLGDVSTTGDVTPIDASATFSFPDSGALPTDVLPTDPSIWNSGVDLSSYGPPIDLSMPLPNSDLVNYLDTAPPIVSAGGPMVNVAAAVPTAIPNASGVVQPVNVGQIASASGGLLSAIANFFKPTSPALASSPLSRIPVGYGYNTAGQLVPVPAGSSVNPTGQIVPGASFLSQSSILPGMANSSVLMYALLAVGAVVLIGAAKK